MIAKLCFCDKNHSVIEPFIIGFVASADHDGLSYGVKGVERTNRPTFVLNSELFKNTYPKLL